MRINNYPFFLWLTQKREDFKLDLTNQKIVSDELGESSIKKVPLFLVLLLKYVPFLFLPFFMYYPKYSDDWIPFAVACVIVPILFLIYSFNSTLLKFVLLIICLINFYLVFTIEDYAVGLDIGITFFVELTLIGMFLVDIFLFKGYKNWYYLESFRNEINIKFTQRKERKFLFFKKETGFNSSKKVYLKGYFLRIEDEDIK